MNEGVPQERVRPEPRLDSKGVDLLALTNLQEHRTGLDDEGEGELIRSEAAGEHAVIEKDGVEGGARAGVGADHEVPWDGGRVGEGGEEAGGEIETAVGGVEAEEGGEEGGVVGQARAEDAGVGELDMSQGGGGASAEEAESLAGLEGERAVGGRAA